MENRNIVLHDGKHKYELGTNGDIHCIIRTEDHDMIRNIVDNLSSAWTRKHVEVIIGSPCDDSALSRFTDIPIIKEFIQSKPSDVTNGALSKAYDIVQERLNLFRKENVKNIDEYNDKVRDTNVLPSIVVIIEELQAAELVNWDKMKPTISKMLDLVRVSGVYLIFVTSDYKCLQKYIEDSDVIKLNCRY